MKRFSKFKHEAGVDEAGRGSLAGPVTAAAVILGKNFNQDELKNFISSNEKNFKENIIKK